MHTASTLAQIKHNMYLQYITYIHTYTGQMIRNMNRDRAAGPEGETMGSSWAVSVVGNGEAYPLMWLQAVSLAASSLLISTTAATQIPNKTQTSNYVRSTPSSYRGSETEKKRQADKMMMEPWYCLLWSHYGFTVLQQISPGRTTETELYILWGRTKGCLENDSSQLKEIF